MTHKSKFYVVWRGAIPGIYTTWTDCLQQVKGNRGSLYKAFNSREEAEKAYAEGPKYYLNHTPQPTSVIPAAETQCSTGHPVLPANVEAEALAVDAACSGNPGPMEYRGIYLRTGQEVFHYGPVYGTNNIGEFLAIVHGLAELERRGLSMPVYSDSRNALLWVRQKRCKTKLERTPRTEELFRLIDRAEQWLRTHPCHAPLLKWETDRWGEIPADFGRK